MFSSNNDQGKIIKYNHDDENWNTKEIKDLHAKIRHNHQEYL